MITTKKSPNIRRKKQATAQFKQSILKASTKTKIKNVSQ